MSSQPPSVPASQRELDPLLLLPVRLFVACLLSDMRWYEDVTVRSVLCLSERRLIPHIEQLRGAGYLQTRPEGSRTSLRLTSLGLDRLTEHVTALQAVARAASELLAATRDALSRSDSP